MARIPESEWKWFGNAGHLIVAAWCRFHMCTQIGDYMVSTVGEYSPDRVSREIHARLYDPQWLAQYGIRGPWMIIKAEDALYPQYDLGQRLADLQESAKAWLKEQAAVKLERNPEAHPQVIAHWKKLAGGSSSKRKNDHES